MNKTSSMTNSSLQNYGRALLYTSAAIYTLLTVFVIGIFITSGGEKFMLDDFGGAWIMLTKQYPHVAEDFLHAMKSNLITSLGVGLFSLTILKFAFKHGERWAWFIMWVLPLSMIEDIFYGISKGFGFEYFFGGLVVIATLGLLISYRVVSPER